MYWQVVLAALTLAGYLESITVLPIAVCDAACRDTQMLWAAPCYNRDPQMYSQRFQTKKEYTV